MTDRARLLTALLARRAETAADISPVEFQLRQHYKTLRSLDHLIRVEDPKADLPTIRNKKIPDRPKTASTLVRGEVCSCVFGAVRH